MKSHLHSFLAGLLLFTACQATDEVPPISITATPESITLGGTAGASTEFTITAEGPWFAGSETTSFVFSPTSGDKGTTTITVTTVRNNSGTQRIELGTIGFYDQKGIPCTTVPVVQELPVAPQAVLFLMLGRGNLEAAFERNIINAMNAVRGNILGDSRILIFRQTGSQSAEIIGLFYDSNSGKAIRQTIKNYNEALVSTDGETLTRVMNDMLTLAPAERYGLIMGSHGTGWIPATYTSIASTGGLHPDTYWEKDTNGPQTRAFGLDNYKTMDIKTLAQSIGATGKKFEYLIFDACLMSSIEALYEMRNTVPRIVGSPCEVMLYGFPYETLLKHLYLNEGRDYDLTGACQAFYDFYSTTTATEKSGCIALTDCTKLDALADVMKRINTSSLRKYDASKIQIYEGLSPHLFYDFGNYVRLVCNEQNLYNEFLTTFDLAFPPAARLHTPTFFTAYGSQHIPVTDYSGVSISEPSTKYTSDNQATSWYKATH